MSGLPARDTFATLAGPMTGLTFLTGVFGAIAAAEGTFPRPGSPDQAVRDYYETNTLSPVLSATGQLLSTLFLARLGLATDEFARAKEGGPRVRVVNAVGTTVAVLALGTSAVTTARLRGPERHDARQAARLSRRAFVAGGPVHGVGFGLMTAAIGMLARRHELVGNTTHRLAVTSSAAGLVSPAYFAAEPLGWLIPIGRFTGLGVAAVVGPRLAQAGRR